MAVKKNFKVNDVVIVKELEDIDRGGSAHYNEFAAVVRYVDPKLRQMVVLHMRSLRVVHFSSAKVLMKAG